jgi:TonB family protein
MYESGREGPQYDPLPDPLPYEDDLALRPQEAAPGLPDLADPDLEPELLGPARRSDRSWGTLAAAAVLTVALLGAFLWFHRTGAPRIDPPPFAPPAVAEQPAQLPAAAPPAVVEPDPPAPAEPEIVEEPDDTAPAEPEEPSLEMAPGPARTRPPVQTAEAVESPEPAAPTPRAPKAAKPERPRSTEPVRIAEARRAAPPIVPAAPPAPKRVAYGPPADRMAGVLRPGPGVEMPVPLDLPRVRYPEAARGSGLKVDVHLDLLVDEQGKVVEAVVREGDPANLGFNEAAVQAALGTRFQPATRWDLPGKAWTELILEFEEPRLEPERGR